MSAVRVLMNLDCNEICAGPEIFQPYSKLRDIVLVRFNIPHCWREKIRGRARHVAAKDFRSVQIRDRPIVYHQTDGGAEDIGEIGEIEGAAEIKSRFVTAVIERDRPLTSIGPA